MLGRNGGGYRLLQLLAALMVLLAVTLSARAQTVETSGVIRLKMGESRSVRLPETPSTGYSWRMEAGAGIGPDPVRITDRGYARPQDAQGRIGAAGMHVWQLTGVSPGTRRLTFVYIRPWEPQQVARRHVLTVQVAAR